MEEAVEPQESFWVVIPHSVLSNKNLTYAARLVYGEISSLTRKDGYCFAHNSHFKNVLGITQQGLNKCLVNLEEENLIKCEITHIRNSKKGTFRKIYLCSGEVQQSNKTGTTNLYDSYNAVVPKIDIHNRDTKENIPKGMVDEPPKYVGSSVTKLQTVLKEKYPIPLTGITDRKKLYNVIQVLTPRKGTDEWMDSDWRKNLVSFMNAYLASTKEEYYSRGVDSLKDKIKLWREYRGKLN